MDIRNLDGKDDIQTVAQINALAWHEAYDDILPKEFLADLDGDISNSQAEDRFEEIANERSCFLVATDETDTVRGYIYLRWGNETKEFVMDDEAGLKEVYVEPDYWKRGIGTKLLKAGLSRLPDRIERVKLNTFTENEQGRQFYRSHGFEWVGSVEIEIAGVEYQTAIYSLRL